MYFQGIRQNSNHGDSAGQRRPGPGSRHLHRAGCHSNGWERWAGFAAGTPGPPQALRFRPLAYRLELTPPFVG